MRKLFGATVAAILAAPILGVPAADAVPDGSDAGMRGKKVFRDKVRDARRGYDMTHVGVWNKRKRRTYYIAVTGRFTAKRAQIYHLWVDTKRRNKGPEYRIISHSNRDPRGKHGVTVARVKGWRDNGNRKRCGYKKDRWRIGKKNQIDVAVKKKCLGGRHKRIRVSVSVWDVTKYKKNGGWRGKADYAPGRRKMSRWVHS